MRIVSLIAVLLPLGLFSAEAPELLQNGDFEQRFKGWHYPSYDGKMEPGAISEDAYGGRFCYRMGREGDGGNRIEQGFRPVIGKDIVIHLYLKCERVKPNDFLVRILLRQGKKVTGFLFNPPGSGIHQLLSAGGTCDWKEVNIRIPAASMPPATTSCTLFLERKDNGTGTVWIDEISIRSEDPAQEKRKKTERASSLPPMAAQKPDAGEQGGSYVPNRNLLPFDSSFESGPHFFQGIPDASAAWHGTHSLRWNAGEPMHQGYLFRILKPGKPYVFSFYFKSDREDGTLESRLMNQEYGTVASKGMPLSTRWQRMELAVPPQKTVTSFVPFLARTGNATVWLDGFQLNEGTVPQPYSPEAPLAVGVTDRNAPGGILPASPQPLKRTVSLTNYLPDPAVRLSAVLDAPGKEPVKLLDEPLSCPPNGTVRKELTLLPECRPGYYVLRLTASGAGGAKRETAIPFLIAELPAATDRFFGIHSGYADPAEARRRAGAITQRMFLFWKFTLKGEDGHYRIPASWSQRPKPGIDPFVTFQVAPGPGQRNPDGTPDFDGCVGFMCDALRAGIPGDYFEIENEPDLTFPAIFKSGRERGADEYAKLLNRSVPELKKLRPEIKIGIGGVSGVDFNQGFPFLTRVLDQLTFKPELIAVHPYCDARFVSEDASDVGPEQIDVFGKTARLKELLKQRGLSPELWFGEIGWALDVDADPLSSPAVRQGAYTARLLLIARALGVKRVYWFMSDNHIEKERFYYGIWRNGMPLPGAAAYTVAARLLADAVPEEKILDGDIQLFTYRRPDGTILGAVWTARNEPCRMKLPPGTEISAAYDMYGRPVDPKDPAISGEPVYLLGGESLKDALKKAEFDLPPLSFAWRPLSDRKVALRLTNQRTRPLSGTVRLEGAEFAVPERRIELEPGKSVELEFTSRESLSRRTLRLQAATGLGNLFREYRVEIIPSPGAFPVMTDRTWLLPNDPGNGYAGAADLSVSGSVSHDRKNLFLTFDVTDDIHFQPGQQGRLWEGDSLQIALDTRGDALPNVYSYDRNDYEMTFALTPSGPACELEYAYERGRSAAILRSLRYAITRDGNTTRYRITIPWETLKADAAPGTIFGFNFIVNDNDGNGKRFWMGLTPGISESKYPYAYRKIVLSR